MRLQPDEHDQALALTSHLPHIAASVLVSVVPEKYFRLAGPGLNDTTRIASGDAELWAQIFAQNRDNVLSAMDRFSAGLSALQSAVRQGNHDEIIRLLTLAKKNRDALGS